MAIADWRGFGDSSPGGLAMTIEAAGGAVHWVTMPGGIRVRAAHWAEGRRGTVLLLNGRTEFIEKYLETVRALQDRGFAVWTMDWRGQGASARMLGVAAQHILHFDEYLGDLRVLLERHVLPGLGKLPLVLMGHSMGGHLAAHMLSRRPELFARGVLLAPMLGMLRRGRRPPWFAGALVGLACLTPGGARRFGPGTPRVFDPQRPFEGNRLTGCPERYAADMERVRAAPELAVGGVSWGWVRAARRSIAALRDPAAMTRIRMPVLVAAAGADTIVDNRAMRRFALGLPRGKFVEISGARHELLREQDRYRALLWEAVDRFMEGI